MTTFIDIARQRKADADEATRQLRIELEQAERNASEWAIAIAKALEVIPESTNGDTASGSQKESNEAGSQKHDRARVKGFTLAGAAAKILLEKGPLKTKVLAAELQAMGYGKKVKNFIVAVGSALWRRKDLFVNKRGAFHLRTKEIEFVDKETNDDGE